MKTSKLLAHLRRDDGELFASFGDARLVRRLTGKIELIGGTETDRAAARDGVRCFCTR